MRNKRNEARIVATKLIPPAVRGQLTARPRLITRTNDILAARLTFVRAAAGFGKSTLLVQWLDKLRGDDVPVAWVGLDARDTDPANVLAQIIFSVGRATTAISTSTRSLAQEFSFCDAEILLSHLIGDLTLYDATVCLMLDDAHAISGESVRSILTLLVDRAPVNLKIVIASREASWIPIGRMRAFGQLFELSVDDLRFGAEEFAALLTNEGILGPTRKALEQIGSKVEGWVAGLKFAMVTARAAPDHLDRLVGLSGSDYGIADFFKEEVLEKHSPDYFDFLLQTSVLTRMCASLCDAVTGRTDSRDMLDRIECEGLFIFSLDPDRTWYRYHHLFGDFLLAEAGRRDPQRLRSLHAKASHWHEERRLYADAFHHLIQSGDLDSAGAFFARVCEDMLRRGEIAALFDWAGQLPAEVIAKHPIINLTVAWWLIVEWRFSEAEQLLKRMEAQLDSMPPEAGETRHIRLSIVHHRTNIGIYQEKMKDTFRISSELAQEFHDATPHVRATFPLMLLHAGIADLHFDDIERLAEQSYRDFQTAGAPFSLIWHGAVVGTAYLLAGQPDAASDVLRQAIARAERFGQVTGLISMPATCLARVLYEQDEIAEATALMNTHFDSISYCGFVHQLISGYTVSARIAQIEGDWVRAERVIEKGLTFAKARGFERLRLHMIAEKIRMLDICRREEELARLLRDARIHRGDADLMPDPSIETVNMTEIRALTWVRAARHAGRLPQALSVCRRWRDFTLRRGAVLSEIQWRVALADLLCLSGEERQAGRELTHAVSIAAPRQFLRCFLDAGEPVISRLKMLAPTFQSSPVTRDFWARFSKAVPQHEEDSSASRHVIDRSGQTPLLEALTHRELVILQYVSRGYLNREVGEQLCLTEGSIKWHLYRVFQKLGVSKRRQAIEKARSLGLM